VIPNLRHLVVGLGVEDGGGPLGYGLGAPTEPLHVAGGRGRLGMPDEPGDVLQRLGPVDE
jgi:hypothetical protein